MKVAFVAPYDVDNVNSWSGIPYNMLKYLRQQFDTVDCFDKLNTDFNIKERTYRKMYAGFGKNYHPDRSLNYAKRLSRQIKEKIGTKSYDFIFSPGTIPVAYLDVDIPICIWTDATFNIMIDYYYFNVSNLTQSQAYEVDKNALERCRLSVYSSAWAANSAINDYKIDKDKVCVIPFGANIDFIPKKKDTIRGLSSKLNLLFIGREWDRKGADVFLGIKDELNKIGIYSELTFVGLVVPRKYLDSDINVYPFLDKKNMEDNSILRELFFKADLFILPSRQDCTPIVFGEVNSFGIPIITTDSGGIKSIVKNGINGFVLKSGSDSLDYANKINDIISNKDYYKKLRERSREYYESNLNWNSSIEKLKNKMLEVL